MAPKATLGILRDLFLVPITSSSAPIPLSPPAPEIQTPPLQACIPALCTLGWRNSGRCLPALWRSRGL